MKVIQVTNEKQKQHAYFVRKKVFVEEQKVPIELEIDDLEEEATHFVLYHNEEAVGAGRLRTIEDNIGKVERICVLAPYRGKGAGKLLMEEIEKFAKKLQLSKLKLNAQITAIPFYEKLGYTVISEEFMDAGIPHKTMIKTIS